jgi:hypothetical protein
VLTAIGTHDELLQSSPTYRRLYELQFADIAELEVQASWVRL